MKIPRFGVGGRVYYRTPYLYQESLSSASSVETMSKLVIEEGVSKEERTVEPKYQRLTP